MIDPSHGIINTLQNNVVPVNMHFYCDLHEANVVMHGDTGAPGGGARRTDVIL